MKPKRQELQQFQDTVWHYYDQNSRVLPWRIPEPDGGFDPYKIMVSEIMLQQTQVNRVVPKYQAFLNAFPAITDLAEAELAEVLVQWSGLGYNRRAKFLWQAAQKVITDYDGGKPRDIKELVTLPGIGANTAAAIAAYAYNQPVVFIETNIRTVFIYHFFPGRTDVHDKELLPLINATLPEGNARLWYWALMDYGTYLKSTVGNVSRASKHYAKQSKFQGSLRQIRGAVLRHLASGSKTFDELQFAVADERLQQVLDSLATEQMIKRAGEVYSL